MKQPNSKGENVGDEGKRWNRGNWEKQRGLVLLMLFLGISSVTIQAASPGENRKTQVVQVAYCENMPPFQYTDADGYAVGMHIDMLDSMAGKQELEVRYLPYDNKEECIAALDRREVDAVLGYPVNGYDSTKYQSTGELSKGTIYMIARKDAQIGMHKNSEKISSSKAVFELGSIDYAYMRTMGIKQFIAVNSQMRVAQSLMEGGADIAIGTSESLGYILNQKGVQDQYSVLYDQIASVSYSILLNMDNQRLRAMLDTELAELRTGGGYEKIYKNWIVSRDLEQAKHTIWKILIYGGFLVVIAFLVIGVIARVNRMLREKVAEKTEELCAANALLEAQVIKLQNESSLRNRIIEAVPTGILFLDRDFHITLMNPAALKMCDDFDGGVQGRAVSELPLFGNLMQKLDREIVLPRQREDQSYLVEIDEKAEIQKYRCWLHWLKDPSSGMLLMAENVTGEEQDRKEMFEREKAQVLGRLVAGIAHELKNPLMNLKTAVSLILTRGDDPEVKEAFARFIPDEVDRMNRLVEGLLNYSRPTKEKAEAVQLSEVVNNCLYMTHITAKGDKIRFTSDLDDTLFICVQRDILRQALINILINSIWSVEKKQVDFPVRENRESIITVRAYLEEVWVCLSVYDSGIGMSAKELKHCTDPFYTTKRVGTGLGLALTKQFAEENGGTLFIKSEAGVYTEIVLKFRRYEKHEK